MATKKQAEGRYIITSVCKADLREHFEGNKEALARINELTNTEMMYLAAKMCDDYCNQLFWESMANIFRSRFMEE